MSAREKAEKILKEHPYTGSDWIYELLDRLGIIYVEKDLDKVPSLFLETDGMPVIIVDKSESSRRKRELIAHELGHYLFHVGNGILNKKRNPIETFRDERKAELFALYLLVPEDRLSKLVDILDPPNVYDLAEEFGVTVEFMEKRLKERGKVF